MTRVDWIHDCVSDTCHSNDSEQPAWHDNMWFSEDVEQSDDEEGDNILQIVQVGSATPFDLVDGLHFKIFRENQIFGVNHRLKIEKL